MSNVAASVRRSKEQHPENFCAAPKCLWRTVRGDGTLSPCQNHPGLGAGKPLTTSGEVKPGTRIAHIDPAIQGTGKVSWECPNNHYRVRWSDGTYSTIPRASLVLTENR